MNTYSLTTNGVEQTNDNAIVVRLGAGSTPHVQAGTYFESEADRDAVVAIFPKSAKVRASSLSTWDRNATEYTTVVIPSIRFDITFERNGTTGDFNEAGLARWRSFKRAAAKAGLVVRADTLYSATMEEFEAALDV